MDLTAVRRNHRFFRSLLVHACAGLWLCAACGVNSAAIDYGAEANPTGDPIGGGPGYSRIIASTAATCVVSTIDELLAACTTYKTAGQIIYIDDNAEIDMTGHTNIRIWPGVTLASGRGRDGSEGALLYETGYGTSDYYFYIGSGGTRAARVTGLRFFGADMEIGDQEGPYQYGSGIHGIGSSHLEVDNCEMAGWGSAAVEFAAPSIDGDVTTASIHHNYFHHNRRNGLGYSVCLGSSLDARKIEVLVEANLFDAGRHFIAGHGDPGNHYTARYNLCLEHDFSHAFDMHGGTDRGDGTTIAGDSVTIYCNTFRDSDQRGICIRGTPRYSSPIYNNWFYHASESALPAPVEQLYAAGNLDIHDNFYGTAAPSGTALPVAAPRADCSSGAAPLAVSFDGSGSYADGRSIVDYRWYFGDGASAVGGTAKGARADYTFTAPGRYNVLLQVKDDHGITSSEIVPVTVFPSTGSCVLSFWVKDSYRGAVDGAYRKEALIDGATVWSSDVAGDDGWVHVVQDVSARVAGKSQVTLTLRTRCLATRSSAAVIQMLFTYWDDVVLFGFETANGDFESSASSAWNYSENGSSWDGRRYTGDLRSGYACYRIMYPSNSCTVNDSGQISQAVTNNAPLILSAMPGGTTVAVQSPVTVAFSEAMEKEAAQTAFCLSPSVAGSFAWQGNTMVFTPAVSLQPAATYTVTVTTGARDQAGLGMAAAHAWQFSTGTSVPELSIVSPADGSLVSGMATIQAEASDPAGITKVDFYVDGLRERTLTAPPFSWEWDSGAVSIGTHSIRVVATGTGGGSTEKTITVRTLGPENENEIVYPNPYINGKSASPGKIFFSHLTGNCTVRIYTVSGGLIATIAHRQGAANTEEWDISGVAGGIYLYSITDGKTTVKGKIGIIK